MDAQSEALETLGPRERQCRRGIQSAGEQHDRSVHGYLPGVSPHKIL
jgi:hypothetical protein